MSELKRLYFHEFGYDKTFGGNDEERVKQASLNIENGRQNVIAEGCSRMPDLAIYAAHLTLRTNQQTTLEVRGVSITVIPEWKKFEDVGRHIVYGDADYRSIGGIGVMSTEDCSNLDVLATVTQFEFMDAVRARSNK